MLPHAPPCSPTISYDLPRSQVRRQASDAGLLASESEVVALRAQLAEYKERLRAASVPPLSERARHGVRRGGAPSSASPPSMAPLAVAPPPTTAADAAVAVSFPSALPSAHRTGNRDEHPLPRPGEKPFDYVAAAEQQLAEAAAAPPDGPPDAPHGQVNGHAAASKSPRVYTASFVHSLQAELDAARQAVETAKCA